MKKNDKLGKNSIPKCGICGKEYEEKHIKPLDKSYYSPVCDCEEKHTKNWWRREQGKKIILKIKKIKDCGLGKRYKDKNFSNYDKSKNPKAYKICLDYSREIEDRLKDGRGLFLTGNIGTGKTHLAAAIVDYIARMKKRKISIKIVYSTVVEMLAEIKMGFREEEKDIVSKFKEADLLIVDDLGVEKVTDWVSEVFYRIVDYRYSELKPTIFVSNLKEDELKEKIGERIMSRIYEMCRGVEFVGKDYRVFK